MRIQDQATVAPLLHFSIEDYSNWLFVGISRVISSDAGESLERDVDPFPGFPVRKLSVKSDLASVFEAVRAHSSASELNFRFGLARCIRRFDCSLVGAEKARLALRIGERIDCTELVDVCLDLHSEPRWVALEREYVAMYGKSLLFAQAANFIYGIPTRTRSVATKLRELFSLYDFLDEYAPLLFAAALRHAPDDVVKTYGCCSLKLAKYDHEMSSTAQRVIALVPTSVIAAEFYNLLEFAIENGNIGFFIAMFDEESPLEINIDYEIRIDETTQEFRELTSVSIGSLESGKFSTPDWAGGGKVDDSVISAAVGEIVRRSYRLRGSTDTDTTKTEEHANSSWQGRELEEKLNRFTAAFGKLVPRGRQLQRGPIPGFA